MIGPWRRYRALATEDRRLLWEALALLALVRGGLVLLPFASVRRFLRGPEDAMPERGEQQRVAERVAWAMRVLSRRSPGPATCLAQALVAEVLLRRRGARSVLRFGVRRPDGGPPQAHAWVECGRLVVVGAVDDLAEYRVLAAPESP